MKQLAPTGTPTRTVPPPTPGASRAATTAVARLVSRLAVRSVVVWGYVFAAYVVGSITGIAATFKTQASREQLARTFGNNPGVQALLGPARHLDTIGGFASWRSTVILTIAGAVWALLTATRLLRGEEESGRWEVLLSGWTTRRRATTQALAGLATALVVLFAVTAAVTVADGRTVHPAIAPRAGLFFAFSLTLGAVMFLAVGAFTSQLARTRRRAATLAGAVLGVAYLIRLVADSTTGLGWLRWASPIGWVEELRPLVGSTLFALVPIAAFTAVLTGFSIRLAGTRDVGLGLLAESDVAEVRPRLLRNPTTLAARLLRAPALSWLAAVAGIAFVEGLIAKGAAGAVSGSAAVQKALARLGGRQGGTLAYIGLSFLVVTTMLALVAAGHAAANREEEATGRLDNFLARPVGRWSWLGGRLAVEAVILVGLGVVAGMATWLGAATQHSGVGFGKLVEAGVNVVPPALFLLGFGALVHAVVPRWTTAATYGLVGWGFLLEFVGSVVRMSHWILDTSILYHVAPAPAAAPDWGSAAGLIGLGVAGFLAGGIAFRRRDVTGA